MVKRSKTSPFHGGNPSSNLGRVTKKNLIVRWDFFIYAKSINIGDANEVRTQSTMRK